MGGSKKILGNATTINSGEASKGWLESGPGEGPCAVFLKESVDFFGEREQGVTGIWCIGHYLRKKSTGIASIRLMDQSEEEIAEEDVQMLTKKDRLAEPRFCCDALTVVDNPEELELGDLVYGEFQKGHQVEFRTKTTKVYFRGRVADLSPSKKTCDIIYDDGDYETSVPYAHVMRVVLKEHKTAWINGITVTKTAKHKKTGTVTEQATIIVDDDKRAHLHYSASNEDWQSKVSIKAALQLIFMQAKNEIPDERCLPWPQDNALPLKRQSPSADEDQSQHTKKAKDTCNAAKKATSSNRRKPSSTATTPTIGEQNSTDTDKYMTPQLRRPDRAKRLTVYKEEEEEEDLDDDSDTPMDDSEFSGAKLKQSIVSNESVRRTQRSTARKGTRQQQVIRSDVPAFPDEFIPVTAMDPLPESPRTLVALSRMEATTMAKVFADEPVAAKELITMNLVAHGKIPSDDFWKVILNQILFGPRHEEIFFPDCYRMEITTDYILSLFRISGLLQNCSDSLSEDFLGDEAFGDALMSHMAEDYYMAADDTERETATERIFNTVHAKSCSSRVFLELVRFHFHNRVVEKEEPSGCHLFRRTPKECLRQAILVAKSIWKLAPRASSIAFRELTETWGSVLSYFAWWYGKSANEDADALADLLSDISMSVPPSLLFDVIDSLKPEIIPQVRPKLAQRWGLSEEYNLCYSS